MAILGWVLFVPLVVDLDSDRATCEVRHPGTLRFRLTKELKPQLSLFGIPIPLSTKGETSNSAKEKKGKTKTPSVSPTQFPAFIRRIVDSITIRRLAIDIDMDDVVLNAKLIPLFYTLSHGPVHLQTNFRGRVYGSLLGNVRLYKIAWAFIMLFTKK